MFYSVYNQTMVSRPNTIIITKNNIDHKGAGGIVVTRRYSKHLFIW